MHKVLSMAAACFVGLSSFAGDGDYAVSKIPAGLLTDANAVVRFEDIRFEVLGMKETVETHHYVITILNENGDDWAQFSEYYDKLKEITSVEGVLYDANGKQLKKMKSKDLKDEMANDGYSMVEDNRMKSHNFYYRVYPYTIEYTVESKFHHTMIFPGWLPQGGERISVEQSHYEFVCPSDYQFRYKAFNYPAEPLVASEKNKKITSWSVTAQPAIVWETFGPAWRDVTTSLITGPTDFQVGDYKGNLTSWDAFGRFMCQFKAGRDNLPDKVKQDVHKLADGTTDEKKKIQVLYEYMQKNTRYVSIQLGIGGWQPFDANYVAEKGYGDCKALSNYMYSLLKEAGIRSDYTLIRSGTNASRIADDFPAVQFDHAILCVPLKKDTVWLECTSQTLPAGYLSSFTSDRYALAIDENGSKMVRTPKYDLKDNLQVRKLSALVDSTGALQMEVNTRYDGVQQDEIFDVINDMSKDKVKEMLRNMLDLATYDVDGFEYDEVKSIIPQVHEKLNLYVSNYATVTGKRLFIIPNVMNRSETKLLSDETRKYPIVFRTEYKDIDSVEIEIPKGYQAEASPTPVTLETKFGKYSCSMKLVGNKIIYYREREQYSGTFSSTDYLILANFLNGIAKADRAKMVLVKNDNH